MDEEYPQQQRARSAGNDDNASSGVPGGTRGDTTGFHPHQRWEDDGDLHITFFSGDRSVAARRRLIEVNLAGRADYGCHDLKRHIY